MKGIKPNTLLMKNTNQTNKNKIPKDFNNSMIKPLWIWRENKVLEELRTFQVQEFLHVSKH